MSSPSKNQSSKEHIIPISGVQYHTLLEGPPSGPLVLLIHALMSNFHMWDSTILPLHAAGYRTLRYDHIGHGTTPAPNHPPEKAFTMDDLVHHAHKIIESATGKDKVEVVIGCSIGGVLALRYAMLHPPSHSHPSNLKKIISIAAPGISTPAKAKLLWPARIKLFEEDVRSGEDTLCKQTVERWFPGSLPRDLQAREMSLRHVRACSLEGYRILAEAISNYDYDADVERLFPKEGVECLVVAGDQDGAVDLEHLRELSERIPGGAEFRVMEGGGHLPPLQMEGEFEGVLMQFLEGRKG